MMQDNCMTRSEIAEALGITEDAVKALLYRAVRKIREQHPELKKWITEEAA